MVANGQVITPVSRFAQTQNNPRLIAYFSSHGQFASARKPVQGSWITTTVWYKAQWTKARLYSIWSRSSGEHFECTRQIRGFSWASSNVQMRYVDERKRDVICIGPIIDSSLHCRLGISFSPTRMSIAIQQQPLSKMQP
jgi:hypothetical protein